MKTTIIFGLLVGLAGSDKKWMDATAQAGMAEVRISKLAVKTTQNSDVKQLAQMMIEDHGKANDQLKDLAEKKGLTLPTEPSSDDKKTEENLLKLTGDKFDHEYVKVMVDEHKKAVHHFEDADKVTDPDVKAWAVQALPTIKTHLQQAEMLKKNLNRS